MLTRIGGHYTLSLRKGEAETVKEEPAEGQKNDENKEKEEGGDESLMVKVLDDPKSWKRELKKLHSQMCHVPVRRIKANLERGDVWKPEMEGILAEIERKCKVNDCRSRAGGQRGKKPVVSLPRALPVGQNVAMDLKIKQGKKPI